MTVLEGRNILSEELFPRLVSAFELLPKDASGGLGGLTFAQMISRVDHWKQDRPFEDCLQDLVEGSRLAGIDATLQCLGGKVSLPEAAALECLLICQELLNNALKHSGTTELQILLFVSESEVVLTLADNGRGIAKDSTAESGQGLRSLETRVAGLGGTITQSEADDGGVVFVLKLPHMADSSSKDQSSPEVMLGKKIHDGLCQELAVLRMMVTHYRDTVEDPALWKTARDAAKLIEKVCEDARELSHRLLECSS